MNDTSLFSLRGRNALVTGSSRGIGRALALALANAGANVAVHASTASDALERTVADVRKQGVRCLDVVADLVGSDAAGVLYEQTSAGLGEVDILICNASIQIQEPWPDTVDEHFTRQVDVNLRRTFELMQRYTPGMVQRGWGRIVTIGSVQEVRPHPEMVIYAATKCAQTSLVRSLARQLVAGGVTVNNIAPGVIDTDRNAQSLSSQEYRKTLTQRIPAGRIGRPEDCVGTALLLCSDAGSYITGQSIYVDGGMSL